MGKGPPKSAKMGVRKAQKLELPAEGFRDHVTTDGSLLGVSGKWSVCGWSVVQLDHDEEMAPMYVRDAGCKA